MLSLEKFHKKLNEALSRKGGPTYSLKEAESVLSFLRQFACLIASDILPSNRNRNGDDQAS